MHRYVLGLLAPTLMLLLACGGGSGPRTNPASGSGSAPGQSVPVAVASGQTVTAVDIAVPAPVASPAPNAQFLGVCTGACSGASAFGTGAQIHQGETATVFLFGSGLSGNMRVMISGPADIAVSNIAGTTAQDGTSGVEFTAVVQSGAGLGGRTVLLINSQNDITTFTGGLEVVP